MECLYALMCLHDKRLFNSSINEAGKGGGGVGANVEYSSNFAKNIQKNVHENPISQRYS